MITEYPHRELTGILGIIYPEGGWTVRGSEIAEIPADRELPTEEDLAAAWQSLLSAPEPQPGGIEALAAKFATLPTEVQQAFAASFAVVRVLMDAGRADLAAAHVAALPVPAELEPARAEILALLSS